MQEEVEGVGRGMQMVANNLEAINSRIQRYLTAKVELDVNSSSTVASCLTLLAELSTKLKVLHLAPKVVLSDAAALCAACVHEPDESVAVGSALAAQTVVYEQLTNHYKESEAALRKGSDTIRKIKSQMIMYMATNSSGDDSRGSRVALGSGGSVGAGERNTGKLQPPAETDDHLSDEEGVGMAAAGAAGTSAAAGAVKKKKKRIHRDAEGTGNGTSAEAPVPAPDRSPSTNRPLELESHQDGFDGADHDQVPNSSVSPGASVPRLRKRKVKLDDHVESHETQPNEELFASLGREVHPSSSSDGLAPQGSDNPDATAETGSSTSEKKKNFSLTGVITAPVTMLTGAMRTSQIKFFTNRWPELEKEEVLDISNCAWSEGKILKQGFWFVTDQHVAFVASVLKAAFLLHYDDIVTITKERYTVFDNAIKIETRTGETYFLTSFLKRDDSFKALYSRWAR
jgi:hypothetical protein